jgi:hypothetical protein
LIDGLYIVGHKKDTKFGTGRHSQGIEGYEGGPLSRQRPTLGCSANEEDYTTISVPEG